MPKELKITMNEFKTVIESIDSKVQAVAENVQYLRDKMDTEFHSVKEQIAILHVGQTELRAGLTELRGGQTELRSGLKKVESDVTEIKQQLQNREEFLGLERRVAKLESKVA